jgi:type IV secretory pathway TraG/TraD family ATPase VirD4
MSDMRHIITTTTEVISGASRQSGGSGILMHVMASPAASGVGVWGHVPHVGALVTVGLAGAAVAGTVVAVKRGGGPRRSRLSLWIRLRLHIYPGPGFATRWDLWRRYGKPAARRKAQHGRPSLTWQARWFGPWQEYATYHGRAQGWVHRWRVYSTFEDITLIIAPPQEGKSARAAGSIIDAPGPVVVTSIRGDLVTNTAGLRQQRGRIHTFNPEGVGEYGSTFRWNIVAGCEDPVTAVRRAGNMVEAITNQGLSDAQFWEDQGSLVLGAYLHAAGLISGNISTVYQWILERDEQPVEILARHPQAARNAAMQVEEFLAMPERTQSGVITTLNRTLKFMQHPGIVDMLSPAAGEGFDFVSFLTSKDTLYLIASDTKTSPVSPLFVAFLAELTFHARMNEARTGSQRLDPPLTLELDELANIAPIPVDAWASWAAGSGIRINMYGQAWSQFVDRWGPEGSETIWQTAKCKVIFTAGSEKDLNEKVSDMCGSVRVREADEVYYGRDGRERKRRNYSEIDVLPEADVRKLPDDRAVVIRRNARPTIVRTEQVWKRKDVRRWERSGEQIILPPVPVRQIATPMPELARPIPAQLDQQQDDLAERRAKRTPQNAPPLPDRRATEPEPFELPHRGEAWSFDATPPSGGNSPAEQPEQEPQPWRPWHGARQTGSDS